MVQGAVPLASDAKVCSTPRVKVFYLIQDFALRKNRLFWQDNVTVCNCFKAVLARLVPFPTNNSNVVIGYRPLTGGLHQCAVVSSFAKRYFSDSRCREVQLKDLNSALGSVSDSYLWTNLTVVLISLK